MQIKKAERKSVKIKLAITGPSGSGKTMSSLLLAKGLTNGGKILVIDSEDGSSNLYADSTKVGVDFDVIELDAPYTIQKYNQAIDIAQKEGYEAIIIDSISHAWAGEGGLLDKKTALDSRGGNSFTNWSSITKEQEAFKAKIIHSTSHVIVTMRSKQDYIVEVNEKGRSQPKKVGLAPVQREGMEYEFTTVFDIAMDHTYAVSKDRTDLFDGRVEKITEKTGEELRQWLLSGKLQGSVKQQPSVNNQEGLATYEAMNESAISSFSKEINLHYADDDRLSAWELWKQLSTEDKKSVWKIIHKPVRDWMQSIKESMTSAEQVPASQA